MNRRELLIGTAAVLIPIVFSLLLAEFVLQAFFYIKNGYPLWSSHKNFAVGYVIPTEDQRQYALKPGYSDDKIEINNQGFRGSSIPMEKQLICVIGDSVPFGSGVANGETFPDFLDKNPVTHAKGFRVLNAGVPSYNFAQSFNAWRIELKDRKCNLLLVNAANDVSLLDFYQSDWSLDKTWASARFNIEKGRHSAIVYYVEKVFKRKSDATSQTVEKNIDGILKKIEADVSEAVASGVKVVLMPIQPCYYKTLPYQSEHSANACKGYPEYEKLAKNWNPILARINNGLSAMANDQTVFFFDTTVVLESENLKDDSFVDFIHYSVSGNQLIANGLSKFVFNKNGL